MVQATSYAPENESILQTAAETKETRGDEYSRGKPGHGERQTDVKSECDWTVNVGTRAQLQL